MNMLLFDFRESEQSFFDNNEFYDTDITFFKEPLNEFTELMQEQYEQTDVICIFTTSHLTEDVLSKFKNLRVVLTRSTSFSHIDLNYCTRHGIAVMNVEKYGQTSVAEFAIALILALIRNVLPALNDVKNNSVTPHKYEGRILSSLTLGIIGCGAIGSAVANIAQFLGMKVLIHSYMKNKNLTKTCKYVSMENLLANSDIISLHLPYNGENYHMLGKEEFELMKDGVYLINTSRGELIDIYALYENLLSGKVAGTGLDVLECEYLNLHSERVKENIADYEENCIKTALITQKLLNLPNVIITPHIAYNTQESVNLLLEATFNNLRDYCKGMNTNRVC